MSARNLPSWSLSGAALALCLGRTPAAAAPAAPAAVEASSATTKTVLDLYKGTRDPFRMPSAGGASGTAQAEPFKAEDFSIHSLDLKGVMVNRGVAVAILVDNRFQVGFVLRGGHVYDSRNKRVPGVTGTIQPKHKSVTLITTDKDVQTLRLGETEEDLNKPVN